MLNVAYAGSASSFDTRTTGGFLPSAGLFPLFYYVLRSQYRCCVENSAGMHLVQSKSAGTATAAAVWGHRGPRRFSIVVSRIVTL